MTEDWGSGLWRRLWRLPALCALLGLGLLIVLGVFPWIATRTRERVIARWSRMLMAACGVAVCERVLPGGVSLAGWQGQSGPGAGRMIVANHVSWLDVFAINSLAPASFAAKAEIASWPLAGVLVARTGTVFVERGRRHAVHGVVQRLTQLLAQGARVAVFPEGTTSDGQQVLPFHGNLVQAALNTGAPVVPVALRYQDRQGRPSQRPLFVGDMTFAASLWQVVGGPPLRVEVSVLPGLVPQVGITRQALARTAQQAIATCLAVAVQEPLRMGTVSETRFR
jgi:1-acyl-sn-glycerol-3-phosphate acyltransferase